MKRPVPEYRFEAVEEVSKQLIIGAYEDKMREDLESGTRRPRQVDYKNKNGVPLSSSITSISAASSDGATVDENVTFRHGEKDVLFSADSMTKTVTAACVLRMTEEKKYSRYLPNGTGIDITLGDLSEVLLKRLPSSNYLQAQLQDPEFRSISLRELMLHTSGIAEVASGTLERRLQNLEDGRTRLTITEILDAKKSDERPIRGQHSYSNLGYEILGAVLVSIHSEANNKPVTENSHYGDVVDELVIAPAKEKMIRSGAIEAAQNLQFYTSDQMSADMEARFGKAFYRGQLRKIPSYSYDPASGGSYATSESMAHIALHLLSDKPEISIFRPETLNLMSRPESNVEASSYANYGLGFYSFKAEPLFRYHGGLGYGSNSCMSVYNRENKAAVAMVAFEQNLTLPLAHALINKTRVVDGLKPDQKLYEKSRELQKNYSEEQLLEMRNSLETSYEDFRKKFDEIQKQKLDLLDLAKPNKPSPNPERSYAEKMSQVKGSKFNEI